MVNVNHIAARGQFGQDNIIAQGAAGTGGPIAAFLDRAKEFGIGQQGHGLRRRFAVGGRDGGRPTLRQGTGDQVDVAGLRRVLQGFGADGAQVGFG